MFLKAAAARLAQAGVSSPMVDAQLLAGHVLGLSRGEVQAKAVSGADIEQLAVHTGGQRTISPGLQRESRCRADQILQLVEERAQRVPLQHLTGLAPFRTLELRVGPGVFIPRPETETVVGLVLEQLTRITEQGSIGPRVADLGTGSGAIAASIAAEFPAAEVHAVEVSRQAAAWAQLNFDQLPPGSAEVTLHHCDLRDFPARSASSAGISPPVTGSGRRDPDTRWQRTGPFDVVVSNPPYIPEAMVPAEQEVHEHDPQIALYGGGEDGLELPRAVIDTAKQILVPGGWLILEHAEVQAEALRRICTADPELTKPVTHQDLSGRDRSTSTRLASGLHEAAMTPPAAAA